MCGGRCFTWLKSQSVPKREFWGVVHKHLEATSVQPVANVAPAVTE